MAKKTVKARLLLKTQTAAQWAEQNPVLLKGEAGHRIRHPALEDRRRNHRWNDLPYRSEGLEVGIAAPSAVDGIPGTFYYDQSAGRLYILLKKTAGNAWEQVALASDLADLGTGDMLASIYAKAAGAGLPPGKSITPFRPTNSQRHARSPQQVTSRATSPSTAPRMSKRR